MADSGSGAEPPKDEEKWRKEGDDREDIRTLRT